MATPDLVTYVRQQCQNGVPAQELRETLMEAGWSEMDVENALHDVAAGLQPVTAGASIHEDLAQVRGLVAHLTSRVGRLETRLIGTASLTEPQKLPSATIGPERALPRPGWRWSRIGSGVIAFAVLVAAGRYLVTIPTANALNILSGTGAISVLFALVSWLFIRRRRSWSARLTAASAAALGGWSTWLAWDRYQLLEWTTAAALGVLLLVYLFVAGRWISRAESR